MKIFVVVFYWGGTSNRHLFLGGMNMDEPDEHRPTMLKSLRKLQSAAQPCPPELDHAAFPWWSCKAAAEAVGFLDVFFLDPGSSQNKFLHLKEHEEGTKAQWSKVV